METTNIVIDIDRLAAVVDRSDHPKTGPSAEGDEDDQGCESYYFVPKHEMQLVQHTITYLFKRKVINQPRGLWFRMRNRPAGCGILSTEKSWKRSALPINPPH